MTQPFDNEKKFYLKTSFILTRDKRLETRDNFRNRVQLSVNTEKKNIRKKIRERVFEIKSAKEYSQESPRKKYSKDNPRRIFKRKSPFERKNDKVIKAFIAFKKISKRIIERKSTKEYSKENP